MLFYVAADVLQIVDMPCLSSCFFFLTLSVRQLLLLTLQSGSKPNDRPDFPLTLHAFSCLILPGGTIYCVCNSNSFLL